MMDYLKLLHHLPGMAFKFEQLEAQLPKIVYCSPGSLVLYKLNPQQILQNPAQLFQVFSEAQLLSIQESMTFCAAENLEWQLVLEVTIDGKNRVHQFYATPERLSDGSTDWYGIVTDITEQFVRQDYHIRHEKLLSTLFDLSPFGIALVDIKTGLFLKTNTALQRMLGYTEHQLAAIGPSQLIAPEFMDDFQRQMLILQYQSRFEPHESMYIKLQKKSIDVLVNGMLLESEEGQTSFWMLIEEISERKASERLLLAEKERAEVAARAKTNFLASMSHEIRTPLNGVIGMLDVLQSGELSAEQHRQIAIAQSSGDALLHLLNDILDFSKMDAGKLELENANVNLESLLETITKPFSFLAQQKGLQFSQHFISDVGYWVKTDAMRLKQILNNLLSNAIKFTEHGQISLEASLRQQQAGLMLTIEVQDTGIGISEHQSMLIFDPFTQADASTTRKYGGTGLGLAICHQLSQLMGGGIHVQSQLGQGACFTLWLSVMAGETEQEQAQYVAGTIAWPATYRILLVDDNPVNCEVVKLMLKNLGVEVSIAADGQQAIQQLLAASPQQAFHLILMDCMMPILDGYQATTAIRQGKAGEHYRAVPIIALTANALLGDREKCLIAGMNGYLSKPVTRSALETEMARVLALPLPHFPEKQNTCLQLHAQDDFPSLQQSNNAEMLLWDRHAFLKSLGSLAEMDNDLVQTFLNTLYKHQEDFQFAVRDQNYSSIQMISHSLKGCAAQMFCLHLAQAATELNKLAKLKDFVALNGERSKFEKILSDTLNLLQQSVNQHSMREKE